jgi:hypothetical protein
MAGSRRIVIPSIVNRVLAEHRRRVATMMQFPEPSSTGSRCWGLRRSIGVSPGLPLCTRHCEGLQLYYGTSSFSSLGGLAAVLFRNKAKETTLDHERGQLYREAFQFAHARSLHIVPIARTLVRGRPDWTLR